MKEVILAFAKYNRGANLSLIATIEKAGEGVAAKETGMYYKTVLGAMQHYFWVEVAWLKRYRSLGNYPSLKVAALDGEIEDLKAKVGNEFGALAACMKEMDSTMLSFAEELKPEDLAKPMKFKNFKGEEQEKLVWQTIFHILNHATHHRGEISAALDTLGVSNDYSGFYRYL